MALAQKLKKALSANVTNMNGEQVQGQRRAVGRDVVMVIRSAQLASSQRGCNLPTEDELLATITDVRDGLVALDSRGGVLARRTDRIMKEHIQPSSAASNGSGLMSLNSN